MSSIPAHRVVIVGGGFGGLAAVRGLRRADVDITLIDRRNFHVFQPLLYQVATGGLSPGDITSALRWILRKQKNVRVWLGEVIGVDAISRKVVLADGEAQYDTLVVATGAETSYFANDGWSEHAPGLKSIEDATEIRRRIYTAFELAERERDPDRQAEALTFVVVGGGPTGVELAGAIAEIAKGTVPREFRSADTRRSRIVLVDAADRVLPSYPAELSAKCKRSLERLGVEVVLGKKVIDIDERGVRLDGGEIRSRTVLWAAGVRANSFGNVVARAAGAATDRMGRVLIAPDLTVPGHPEIFVIGDLTNFPHQSGAPLPGVAPVAQQQGRYVARLIKQRGTGRAPQPFRYVNKGELATIGRAAAVANFGKLRFSGYPAWLLWLFVHLMYIVEFENRVLVFIQWAWNYLTWNRGARLIAHGTSGDGGKRGKGESLKG
ncbi:MAG: NAD(P)/FAD-dependent oxidoreductase [Gemmatimonadales bacterium]